MSLSELVKTGHFRSARKNIGQALAKAHRKSQDCQNSSQLFQNFGNALRSSSGDNWKYEFRAFDWNSIGNKIKLNKIKNIIISGCGSNNRFEAKNLRQQRHGRVDKQRRGGNHRLKASRNLQFGFGTSSQSGGSRSFESR